MRVSRRWTMRRQRMGGRGSATAVAFSFGSSGAMPRSMSLVAVRCPRCDHLGFVADGRLPMVLVCSRCKFENIVRDGEYQIRRLDSGPRPGRPKKTPARIDLDAKQAPEQSQTPPRP